MAGEYPEQSARTALKITSLFTTKRKQLTSEENCWEKAGNGLWRLLRSGPKMARTSSHVWMPRGQNFVAQLSITEVQWNQCLLTIVASGAVDKSGLNPIFVAKNTIRQGIR
jgi:hypothetical protein